MHTHASLVRQKLEIVVDLLREAEIERDRLIVPHSLLESRRRTLRHRRIFATGPFDKGLYVLLARSRTTGKRGAW